MSQRMQTKQKKKKKKKKNKIKLVRKKGTIENEPSITVVHPLFNKLLMFNSLQF